MAETVTPFTVHRGYSATVEMALLVGERWFRVGQAGPDFVVLDSPKNVPPGSAELIIEIDGDQTRRQVFLPNGIRADDDEVKVTSRPT